MSVSVETTEISELDLSRVRELRRVATQCLLDINRILQPYVDFDVAEASAVRVSLFARHASHNESDGGVPPVYQNPVHVVYGPDGNCAYELVDPPGVCRPCS